MKNALEHYKELARAAAARGDDMAVCRIIGLHLSRLFDDDQAAFAFYRELECKLPNPLYQPMLEP